MTLLAMHYTCIMKAYKIVIAEGHDRLSLSPVKYATASVLIGDARFTHLVTYLHNAAACTLLMHSFHHSVAVLPFWGSYRCRCR